MRALASPRAILLLGALIIAASSAGAASLTYRVAGVDDETRANVRAYLGKSPQGETEAERFIQNARGRVESAMEAVGFYEPTVYLTVDRSISPIQVLVTIEPGRKSLITQSDIAIGGEGVDDPELQKVATEYALHVGDPLHHGDYEALKRELQRVAHRRGYFDARFSESSIAVDVRGKTAELRLHFDTGARYRFGPVVPEGDLVDPDLLERLRPFSEHEAFEQNKLLEFRQRLLRLGFFSSALVLPDLAGREAGVVPIRVSLDAAARHSFEVGAGYSTDTRQRFSGSWRSPRLNRHGHSQETILRWSPVNPEARVTYSIPLDDPAQDVLQIIGRVEDNEFGDLQSEQRAFKVRRETTYGARVSAYHLRYLEEDWGVFADAFEAAFALAGASFSSRNRSGPAVDPSAGISQFYSVEAASVAVGSDEDLLRLYGHVIGVKRLSENWRVVGRIEGGALWSSSRRPDELPPSLAFFAGGDNSIRGYGYQSLGREVNPSVVDAVAATDSTSLVVGGTRLVTGSVEIQRYFSPTWRGAVFVDGGDAFVDNFDMNIGAGVGVHYLSPVGALRLEVANAVTESGGSWRLHINIGAEF
ncbi:MAG: autotransporter assembly complex family protein [Pseudomonadota bacterium]